MLDKIMDLLDYIYVDSEEKAEKTRKIINKLQKELDEYLIDLGLKSIEL